MQILKIPTKFDRNNITDLLFTPRYLSFAYLLADRNRVNIKCKILFGNSSYWALIDMLGIRRVIKYNTRYVFMQRLHPFLFCRVFFTFSTFLFFLFQRFYVYDAEVFGSCPIKVPTRWSSNIAPPAISHDRTPEKKYCGTLEFICAGESYVIKLLITTGPLPRSFAECDIRRAACNH